MVVIAHSRLNDKKLEEVKGLRAELTNILMDAYFLDRDENRALFLEARRAYVEKGISAFDSCYKEIPEDTQGQFVLKVK